MKFIQNDDGFHELHKQKSIALDPPSQRYSIKLIYISHPPKHGDHIPVTALQPQKLKGLSRVNIFGRTKTI